MTPEQMQKIVDGAPEWAENFNVYLAAYGTGGIPCKGDILLADLRAQLSKHDLLRLEAIICDGDKISDEARELIKDGFVGSTPTMKAVIDRLNKEKSIQVLDLRDVDIPHGTIVLEK